MLTAEQQKAREGKLTASRVGVLMTGSEKELYDLWREVIGDPTYQHPDLSGVWPVALGSHTESLNLDWYERKRQRAVTRRGEVVVHPEHDWAAVTLDGWDSQENVVIECKHVGGREPLEVVLQRYAAQFHWGMIVTDTKHVYASIIEGANEPLIERVTFNYGYAGQLWDRAQWFIGCVNNMTPPVALPSVEAPLQPVVTYDMTGNNQWCDLAVTWLETKDAAKKAKVAETDLKSLVPADAIRSHGHGVEIKRDRAGRLSLRAA